MRITVSIDDQLLTDAMAATGLTAKHEVIEPRLQTILRLARQEAIRQYPSTIRWRNLVDGVQRDWSRHARRRLRELWKQQRGRKRIRLTWRKPPRVWPPLRRFRVRRAGCPDAERRDITRFP